MPPTRAEPSWFARFWPLLTLGAVAIVLLVLSLPDVQLARREGQIAITSFAFNQITLQLESLPDSELPTTNSALIEELRRAVIDWNSCTLTATAILDSWDQPVTSTFDPATRTWTFISAGPDGTHATGDDITQTFAPKTPASSPTQ